MNRLAIRPHTRLGFCANNNGPGLNPYCWKPASIIAAVADVGRPSVKSGTERSGGGGIVGGFGSGDAFDGALAELVGIFRQPSLD